jgi:hypothetical protein
VEEENFPDAHCTHCDWSFEGMEPSAHSWQLSKPSTEECRGGHFFTPTLLRLLGEAPVVVTDECPPGTGVHVAASWSAE